jgi:hypothetical protein
MRTLRLAGAAARAERLRLRRLARRMALRAALGATAAVFAALALAGLHIAIALCLAERMPVRDAVLWVAAGDVELALLLAWLAIRLTRPGPVECEARAVREQALLPIRDLLAVGRMALRAERLWLRAVLLALQWLSRGERR